MIFNSKARVSVALARLEAAEISGHRQSPWLQYEVERLAGFTAEAERLIAQLGEKSSNRQTVTMLTPITLQRTDKKKPWMLS